MPGLLICVDGHASNEDAEACRACFAGLVARTWRYRPQFVDQIDEIPVTAPDDLSAIRTVGVLLELPEPGDGADESGVRRDVVAVVEAMSLLAAESVIEFVVEYRQEAIAWLDGSAADAAVVDAFFGPG